jgi:hypothetical protein
LLLKRYYGSGRAVLHMELAQNVLDVFANSAGTCAHDDAGFSATYGDLKLNPVWDTLRGDPRFENIVASLAPKNQ